MNGTVTNFIYDNDEVIADYTTVGVLQSEYVYGGGLDELLTMQKGATNYYYHYDGLGSVTEITTAAGAIAERYEYDPYGQVTMFNTSNQIITTSGIANRYMFTGREHDPESGLYHLRARLYDPRIGRFLQRDPIGYVDGMNLYKYVRNNPLNWIDPLGLACEGDIWNILKENWIGTWENFPSIVWQELSDTFYWPANHPEEVAMLLLFGGTPVTGKPVFRVYGGDAKPLGKSWTPDNPRIWGSSTPNRLGLPDSNSGQYIIEGKIKDPSGIIVKPADPLGTNSGGATEYVIPNPERQINFR